MENTVSDFIYLFHEETARNALQTVRWVAPLSLFILTFIAGLIPLTLRLKFDEASIRKMFEKSPITSENSVIHQCLICGCGGTLIATVFLCLLPAMRSLVLSNDVYPGAEICVSSGILFTYLFQELVFVRFGNTDEDYIDQWHIYLVQFIRCELDVCKKLPEPPKSPSVEDMEAEDHGDNIEMDQLGNLQEALGLAAEEAEELRDFVLANQPGPALRRTAYLRAQKDFLKLKNPKMDKIVYFGVTLLCLHSILDGFCLGLQPTDNQTWYVFGNIASHRVIIAISTGIELLASNFKSKSIAYVMLIFSVMPSIGSMFGSLAATSRADLRNLAFMIGMSGGSLLYVTFFELFRGFKKQSVIGVGQCLSAFCGYLISLSFYMWLKRNFFF